MPVAAKPPRRKTAGGAWVDALGLVGLVDHRLPLGVVALDRAGSILEMNHVARSIQAARDGLALVDGALVAVSREDAPRLQRLLSTVCRARGRRPGRSGGSISISRPSDRRGYAVLVTAVDFDGRRHLDELAAIVFINDPEEPVASLTTTLEHLYGLADREVHLMPRLFGGMTIRQIATADAVEESTARTHRRRVFFAGCPRARSRTGRRGCCATSG